MYQKELKIAKSAAKEAGKLLKKEFFNLKKKDTQYKIHNERVTYCDKKSEDIIIKKLNAHFPNYARVSEESGRKDKPSDYSWIIDPLDGTTNFTIHHSMFSVSIALIHKEEIVLGVTYDPILDELYYASKNNGAYKNNKKLKMSPTVTLNKSFITYCHGSGPVNTKKAYKLYEHFHNKSHHCRHFGCTTLEMAMVASGRIEAYMVSGAKLWDVAAGTILIKEAGGKITDWQGKEWNIKSKTILGANKKIHAICRRELKKIRLA